MSLLLCFVAACAEPGAQPDVDTSVRDSGAEHDAPPMAAPDASVPTLPTEIGTGATGFEALDPNDQVDIVAGPQGGYHIWTSVRVQDLPGEVALVGFSARFEEDDSLVGPPTILSVHLAALSDGTWEKVGLTNFVTDPETTRGRPVRVRVEVFAPDGGYGLDDCAVLPR